MDEPETTLTDAPPRQLMESKMTPMGSPLEPKKEKHPGETVLILLLAVYCITFFTWTPFRKVNELAFRTLLNPLRTYLPSGPQTEPPSTSSTKLAERARSMEFRIQEFRIHAASLETWLNEWKCSPLEEVTLLRFLLTQLPEAGTREAAAGQRKDVVQAITILSSRIRKSQPDNAFSYLADALVLFYLGQDGQAIQALRQGQQGPHMNLGLDELNRSELSLWRQEKHGRSPFPVPPRHWNLDLERPLQALSRGLLIQEKTLLQKYNFERGIDLTMVHLGLAAQLSESAWNPSDFATAHAMARRALEPYWTAGPPYPDLQTLARNFYNFLDDQGDRLSSSKIKAWSENWESQQRSIKQNLRHWRRAQALAVWNVSSVASSVFLQTCSFLLVWLTLLLFPRPPSPSNPITRFKFQSMTLFVIPILWAFLGWPPGTNYLIAGTCLTWLMWSVVALSQKQNNETFVLRGQLVQSLLLLLITLTLITTTATGAWIFREQVFQKIAVSGWTRSLMD